MNKILQNIRHNRWITYIALLLVGVFAGWLLSGKQQQGHQHHAKEENKKQIWTCSMDPQVKQDHPGTCPICGMDLIPMTTSAQSYTADPNAVTMSEEAVALANIETQVVGTATAAKQIMLYGKVEPDQRLLQAQSAYAGGRVERLFINAVGDVVRKGQPIATIYSPELYTASQELIAALNYPDERQRKVITDAAIEKLMLLNVDRKHINTLLQTRKASPYITLRANTSGTVVTKNIQQGDYVRQGDVLLNIADLSRVWVVFKAYENDLPFIRKGSQVSFNTEAMPGQTFTGRVAFVDAVIDAQTRTAGVRVEIANRSGKFKPEMLVTGHLSTNEEAYRGEVVVPKSAVLWTGKRSVVYVKDDSEQTPTFILRRITLGASLPGSYVVLNGLAEGEEIVTNGAFAVDASAQLEGKESMMGQ